MPRVIRSPEKQIQHKKKRRMVSVLVLLCLGGFAWLIIYIPSLPSLQIKNILVLGNKVLTEEEIKQRVEEELSGKYLRVFPKTNVFLYPQKPIEESLLPAFPRVASVSAHLDTKRVLTITLTEREPFALWCGREEKSLIQEGQRNCFYLDDTGFAFSQAPSFSGNAYFEFYGKGELSDGDPTGSYFLPLASYRNILKIKKSLEGMDAHSLSAFVGEDNGVLLFESAGYGIRFNLDQNADTLESNMQAVFHSSSWGDTLRSGTLEYMDFRFGNKVYYKYWNEESGATNQE